MDETFNVTSMFYCNYSIASACIPFDVKYKPNPVWRQTYLGCEVIKIIQIMYHFNVSFVNTNSSLYSTNSDYKEFFDDNSSDIYATPMALTSQILDYAYPIHPIIRRRFGFILKRSQPNVFTPFYVQPFKKTVWGSIFTIAFIVILIFYMLKVWEERLLGRNGECSLSYEILVVFGGLCQHILSIKPLLTSRRIAYFTFIMFSYVMYSYYSSNLLSYLVSDRDEAMTLERLVESNYELVVLEHTQNNLNKEDRRKNINILKKKMVNVKYVNISAGLEAVSSGTTALYSDFITVYPYIWRSFSEQLICDLGEVEVYSNIKLYFFTSKHFAYKEKAKIGLLRLKETGVLSRLMSDSAYTPPRCSSAFPPHTHYTYFLHTLHPICFILSVYILAVVVMIAERVHYRRIKLWPYVN